MGLAPGVRLGPYEVLALVGAGGMGEVYKARDTRLDRSVALKVLPAAFAADPQFRERFEREAKSISALNHPNICTLHDIGRLRVFDASASQGEEIDFLVMEFLEGETLATRLTRGAVPLPEALKIATEIAGALDRAHRQGIVHRDLKPGNVMLTKTGAKLLDFGLAKTGLSVATSAVSVLPTMSGPLTARGTILGTFQYMAPEQVEGEEADARTDIFAFGALLFELVTGRKAFDGKSQASLMSAILRDQPLPVSQVQPVAPAALDHLVRACLAKDREDRIQTAHDVVLQLRWMAEGGSGVSTVAPIVTPRRKWRERAAWAAALALVSAAAIWLSVGRAGTPVAAVPIAFTVETPGAGPVGALAVSPDAQWLVFARAGQAQRTTNTNLWMRRLGSTDAVSLEGTENPGWVFWSPDSRSIAYRNEGRLKRLEISTGIATSLCALPSTLTGGTWGGGNEIIFGMNRALYRVSASGTGGEPAAFLQPDQTSLSGYFYPTFLPDSRHILFFAIAANADRTGIYVVDTAATPAAPVFVTKADSASVYSPTGHLLFIRENTLLAQPFDAGTRRTLGDPVSLAVGFATPGVGGRTPISSGGNVMAYRTGARREAELAWYDRQGAPAGVVGTPGGLAGVRLSPDDSKVAYGRNDPRTGQSDIWTIDLETGIDSRLTNEPGGAGDKFWSPDGRSVAFWSRRKGKTDLYHHALGAREAELIYESPEEGKWIDDWFLGTVLFHMGGRLFSLPFEGERKPRLLVESLPFLDQVQASRDGRWLAYGSNSSGRWEVYVAPMNAPDRRRQVSAQGGGQAHWRRDGRELFYLAPDGAVMSVVMKSEDAGGGPPQFAAPVRLFQSPIVQPSVTSDEYDVTNDGRKFLFVRPRGDVSDQLITVSINWTAALKK